MKTPLGWPWGGLAELASPREYDPVRKEARVPSQTRSLVKPERGLAPAGSREAAGLRRLHRTVDLFCPSRGEEMAHEVDLESFKELEREVILGVLYRDQAVQSMEEERVR